MMDSISDTTISNYIRQIGNYKLTADIDTPNTEIYYYHGTKMNELLAKKTAAYIRKKYPNSKVKCFKGKGHCEDSLLNPAIMIAELDMVLGVTRNHNIPTNYSQVIDDSTQIKNRINIEIEKDK